MSKECANAQRIGEMNGFSVIPLIGKKYHCNQSCLSLGTQG